LTGLRWILALAAAVAACVLAASAKADSPPAAESRATAAPATAPATLPATAPATTRAAKPDKPPEPPWLVRTSIGVMIVGGLVLVAWAAYAVKSGASLGLPPMPKESPPRIGAAEVLGGLLLWVILQLAFAQGVSIAMGIKELKPTTPEQTIALLSAGVLGQLAAAAAILWMLRTNSKIQAAELGLRWDTLGRALGIGLLAFLATYPVIYGVYSVTEQIALRFGHAPQLHPIVQQATEYKEHWYRIALTLAAVVGAPVMEEFFFRGFLQTSLRRAFGSRQIAIVVGACVFALVHFAQWESMPALFVLGLGLGYAFEKTGRLAAPMLCHMLFNGMTMLRFF